MNATKKKLCLLTVLAALACATNLYAARISVDARSSQNVTARQALWEDATASMLADSAANLEARNSTKAPVETVAYWRYNGWYGRPYWGGAPYRYYGYGAPYSAYYYGNPNQYNYAPGPYYGPRVSVRVYPYGSRAWRGYW
jgi:hypothetical protein